MNVAGASITLSYDPATLTITGGTTPISNASISVNTDVPGTVTVVVTKTSEFASTAGQITLANLTASVPTTAPNGAKAILDLSSVVLQAVDTSILDSSADDGIQIAAYRGDVNNTRSITTGDVTGLLRTLSGAFNTTGFPNLKLADPVLVGDMNDNSALTTGDVTGLLRFLSGDGGGFPAIPAIPAGLSAPPASPDPVIFIPTNLTVVTGNSINVPINIHVTELAGASVAGFDVTFTYDSTRFRYESVVLGAAMSDSSLQAGNKPGLVRSIVSPGKVRLLYATDSGPAFAHGFVGTLSNVRLTALAGASYGTSALNVIASAASDNNTEDLVIFPPALPGIDSNDGAVAIVGSNLDSSAVNSTNLDALRSITNSVKGNGSDSIAIDSAPPISTVVVVSASALRFSSEFGEVRNSTFIAALSSSRVADLSDTASSDDDALDLKKARHLQVASSKLPKPFVTLVRNWFES